METIESQNESFTELETSTTPNKSPRSYLCNECGRTFQSMPGLVRHFRSHTNDKRYKCRDILILMGIWSPQGATHVAKHINTGRLCWDTYQDEAKTRNQILQMLMKQTSVTFVSVNSVEKISSETISKEYISKMLNIAVQLVANDLSGGQV